MRSIYALTLGLVLLSSGPTWSDEKSDREYGGHIAQIKRLLQDTKSDIVSVGPDQRSSALDKIEYALGKAREVMVQADEARRKDVDNDKKRVADKYYDTARDFPESAKPLSQMKRTEIKLREAQYVAQCDRLGSAVKEFVDKAVNDKDHEGAAKIRTFADAQARPVRDKLKEFRSDESPMEAWRNAVVRLDDRSNTEWKEVKTSMDEAAKAIQTEWKNLMEQSERGCEKITKWEESAVVRDGIRALGDKAKSKDEYVAEINREIEQAARALDQVERDSNESDILSAISSNDRIDAALYKLKDAQGTDPKARAMTERWPAITRQFKDSLQLLVAMKQEQWKLEKGQQFCVETEKELLSRVQRTLEGDPFDQNQMTLRQQMRSMAATTATGVSERMRQAAEIKARMERHYDTIRAFNPEPNEWRPVSRNLTASALAMLEYYKGVQKEVERACAQPLSGESDPEFKKLLAGDCAIDELDKLHDKQKDDCKVERSCGGLNTPAQCTTMRQRLSAAQACVTGRQTVMDKCFRGGDARHRRERETAWTVVDNCEKVIAQHNCPK